MWSIQEVRKRGARAYLSMATQSAVKKEKEKMDKSDRNLICAIATPVFVALVAGVYAYADFARNGITSPSIWLGTFFAAFFVFVLVYCISMTIFLWRFT